LNLHLRKPSEAWRKRVRIASREMLPDKFPPMSGRASPNRVGGADGGTDQHGRAARGFVGGGGTLSVGAAEGEGAHSRRAVRHGGLASQACSARAWTTRHGEGGRGRGTAFSRRRKYDATIKDAVTALWEASDRVCGKRLVVMIPTLLPALERHGRLKLDEADRERVLAISAATIDRKLGPTKLATAGGRRRWASIRRCVARCDPDIQ
jgi:hypothetical protein